MSRYAPLIWAVSLIVLAFGALRLRFDAEVLHLLPGQLDSVRGLSLHQRYFTDPRELIIAVDAPTAEAGEDSAHALADILAARTGLVSRAEWQGSWEEKPEEAAELVAYLWYNQSPEVLGELIGRLGPVTLADTRDRLATALSPDDLARAYDPYGLLRFPGHGSPPGSGEGPFASREGTFRLIFVEARSDLTDYRSCRAWLEEMKGLVRGARESGQIAPGVRIGYTGRPAFVAEISSGMQTDMAGCSTGTLAVIALLFWLTHRRLRPLIWLLVVMLVILGGTLALGGLCLGTLNVVSMGFAAILLGLAEDFGILIYQESRSHPHLDIAGLRTRTAPGIFWSALTTAGAFFALNLSALPGLGQLGTMVALGILLAAVVMIFVYLPILPWITGKEKGRRGAPWALLFEPLGQMPTGVAWVMTIVLACGAIAALVFGGIHFDRSSKALESRHSPAADILRRAETLMGANRSSPMVLITGADERDVANRLNRAEKILSGARSANEIAGFTLPVALWPNPDNQQKNRDALAILVGRRDELARSALDAGFNAEALALTEKVIAQWRSMLSRPGVYWPETGAGARLIRKVAARTDRGFMALGIVDLGAGGEIRRGDKPVWLRELAGAGGIIAGWNLLGAEIFDRVMCELPLVVMPIFALVILCLWLAFRSVREILFSLAMLSFSALLLGAVMVILGWKWNLMNIMALPLLLGMGVDFSIHMQLALRDQKGDRAAVRGSIGRALLLAGATTIAGFASLAFSTNAGMASLGMICALGITSALLTAVYLLPVWWNAGHSRGDGRQA